VDLGYFGTYAKFYYSFNGRPSFDTKQIQVKSKKEVKNVDKRLGLSIVILYQTIRIISRSCKKSDTSKKFNKQTDDNEQLGIGAVFYKAKLRDIQFCFKEALIFIKTT